MALMKLFFEHCEFRCPNQLGGCDFRYSGGDRSVSLSHILECNNRFIDGAARDIASFPSSAQYENISYEPDKTAITDLNNRESQTTKSRDKTETVLHVQSKSSADTSEIISETMPESNPIEVSTRNREPCSRQRVYSDCTPDDEKENERVRVGQLYRSQSNEDKSAPKQYTTKNCFQENQIFSSAEIKPRDTPYVESCGTNNENLRLEPYEDFPTNPAIKAKIYPNHRRVFQTKIESGEDS